MRTVRFALGCALALSLWACGDDDGVARPTDGGSTNDGGGTVDSGGNRPDTSTPPTDSGGGGTDAGDSDGGGETPCTADAECDDGNPCNGVEICRVGQCENGTPTNNGESCDADDNTETVDFCVDGVCGPSRCGDGVVDEAAEEQCDDANDVLGDGCDDCRPSCEADADCDDSEECNGAETCNTDTNACVPGMRLVDASPCANGTGVCSAGRCLPDSCDMDDDCDDGDPCNGMETCDTMACTIGTPLDCDDDNACTADSCSAADADNCLHLLVDMDGDGHAPSALGECGTDCDDDDPNANDDAMDVCDGVDNDCDTMVDEGGVTTWHADCDGDRYAAAGAVSIDSCAAPPLSMTMCETRTRGWTTIDPTDPNIDCNDANATVSPGGRVTYFTTPIAGAPEESDYDYNCDGEETKQYPDRATCARRVVGDLFFCTLAAEGWVSATIPECGARANWATGCTSQRGGCVPITTSPRATTRLQGCR